jgi:hypothetical protein
MEGNLAEFKPFSTVSPRVFLPVSLEDFHDLRHMAINHWRLQGHDYFRIMAATGHETLNVLKWYNTLSKDELKALVEENR